MNSTQGGEQHRIVVGVDGFESSKAALRWAIRQAKLTGAGVEAVPAWHIPLGTSWMPTADMPDYQEDAFAVLAEAIDEMCAVDPDVQVCPRVGEGRAGAGRCSRRSRSARRGLHGSPRAGRDAARLGRPVLRAQRSLSGRHHA